MTPSSSPAPVVLRRTRRSTIRVIVGTQLLVCRSRDRGGYTVHASSVDEAGQRWLDRNGLTGVVFRTHAEVRAAVRAAAAVAPIPSVPAAREMLRRDPATGTYWTRCGTYQLQPVRDPDLRAWMVLTADGQLVGHSPTLEAACHQIRRVSDRS